jgi:hypothetical protein
MNSATAIHRWSVPVYEQKTGVLTYPRKNRQAAAADQPLWKICQAESKAKDRESAFYAFFPGLAVVDTVSAFATLHEMMSAGSAPYLRARPSDAADRTALLFWSPPTQRSAELLPGCRRFEEVCNSGRAERVGD